MKNFRSFIKEDTNKDHANAQVSYDEELKAIKDYTKRIAECEDAELKKVFEHNLKEEKDHAAGLKKWLDKNG